MKLKCKDRLLDISHPLVMGVVNLTPDSFFAGSRYYHVDSALSHIQDMISEGASIIDIGGMSSRPGASVISPKEEMDRVLPVIRECSVQFPDIIISIDTVHSSVAENCLNEGAHIVNDISAGVIDPRITNVIKDYNAGYVLMHMQGNPGSMQKNPKYDNVLYEILHFFVTKIRALNNTGIYDIIIDPGLGFGKSLHHNYTLLKNLKVFKITELPIMVGLSRKSMVYTLLQTTAENALNGTTACHMAALINGAKILRVHDVKEAKETIVVYKQLYENDGQK